MKLLKKDEEIIRKDAYTFQTDDGKYLFYNRYIDRFDKVMVLKHDA